MSIPLPLPQNPKKAINVQIVFMDLQKKSIKCKVYALKKANVKDLVREVCKKVNGQISVDSCVMYEWMNDKVRETLYSPKFKPSKLKLVDSIESNDHIVIAEVPKQVLEIDAAPEDPDSSDDDLPRARTTSYKHYSYYSATSGLAPGPGFEGILLEVQQVKCTTRHNFVQFPSLGVSRIMSFKDDENVTCKSVHHAIWEWLQPSIKGLEDPQPLFEAAEPHAQDAGSPGETDEDGGDASDPSPPLCAVADSDAIEVEDKVADHGTDGLEEPPPYSAVAGEATPPEDIPSEPELP